MSELPPFTKTVESAVSGRLLHTIDELNVSLTVPVVLEAHLLPAFIGSSVYFHAAMGPSDGSWPFFPVGGVLFTDDGMTPLSLEDDNHYFFSAADNSIEIVDIGRFEIDGPEDLIACVLGAADQLGLTPWDDHEAASAIEDSTGWDFFDEFMALPIQEFPEASES